MNKKLTYKEAGVDIKAGERLVEKIKGLVKKTSRPECLGALGGFGGAFELDVKKYREPVLIAGTDGVGTKLMVAFLMDKHDTIGIDCVAMCVNDIVVCGAEPLFFLDYLATGKLDTDQAAQVVAGIAEACSMSGCALIGGETAEMPGFYNPGEYDVAGFAVGVVEKCRRITGEDVRPGDVILGLASSGLHSNGFSLVRRIFLTGDDATDRARLLTFEPTLGQTLGDALLTPTRIYVKELLELVEKTTIKGLAHITGGGLTENIPRILTKDVDAHIDLASLPEMPLVTLMRESADLSEAELLRTFNMGIGMVMVTSKDEAKRIEALMHLGGEVVYRIGEVKDGVGQVVYR